MEIWQMMNDIQIELSRQVQELNEKGRNYARSYKKYRVLLAQELLRLKSDKMPVTIAYDIARGLEHVADAKQDELITEALYKSCQEAINVNKLRLKILENQNEREWRTSEKKIKRRKKNGKYFYTFMYNRWGGMFSLHRYCNYKLFT